jgi:hypothetical protein
VSKGVFCLELLLRDIIGIEEKVKKKKREERRRAAKMNRYFYMINKIIRGQTNSKKDNYLLCLYDCQEKLIMQGELKIAY